MVDDETAATAVRALIADSRGEDLGTHRASLPERQESAAILRELAVNDRARNGLAKIELKLWLERNKSR